MPRKRMSIAATVSILAAIAAISVSRRGVAQAPNHLNTQGKIEMISLPEGGNPVNNGYPGLLRDRRGDLWCAWVSARTREPMVRRQNVPYEEGDMIVLRTRHGAAWSNGIFLNTNFGVNFAPVLAEDASGDVIAVWASRREGVDGIWWRHVARNLTLGSEQRVPPAGRLETLPSVVADRSGQVWLAFQSVRAAGSSDIVMYRLEGSGWRALAPPAETPDPEYRPRLAAAPDGGIWCAWDAYSKGQYRVMLRRYDPRAATWSAPEIVPGSSTRDAYAPDLAVDSQGRVWVVYARNEVEEAAYGLRGFRNGGAPKPTSRLAVRESGGSWSYVAPPSGTDTGFVAQGDLPRIAIDSADGVWIAWQYLPNHVDWKVGAAYYQNGGWAAAQRFGEDEPVALDGPPKRADQRASMVSPGAGQLIFAYERGRGVFRNRDIYLREVRLAQPASAGTPRLTRFDPSALKTVEREIRRAPERMAFTASGERRQLYFGDLHNHLLVDDGHQGSVDQLFAIHRDRFASDFGATTSHGDSNKLLISELALNDLLCEASLDTKRFVSIPGFEWTQGDFVVPRAGHRHVLYETPGGPLYRPTEGHSDSIREFTELMSHTNGMIFAHHVSRASTGGTDWTCTNIKVEPAVEMCSSWGRFEYYQNPGHIRAPEIRNSSVQDAWRMGWRLGLIGGSDGHNLFGDRVQGLTGVYATELTRAAIFEAIRKRRSYATTGEPIQVDFRVNGHLMGSEIDSQDGPVCEGTVEGTAALTAVEIVKFDGSQYNVVFHAPLNGSHAKVWWRDPDFRGSGFYYLRVTQQAAPAIAARYSQAADKPFPSEMAWTSPVWVNRK